jgi:predicted MarR family transcription regulator
MGNDMSKSDDSGGSGAIGPVVSAAHLADGAVPELSELEFALTVASNAFQRWMVHCMAAAGVAGLAPIDVQILHAVNHRGRDKTLADLCMMFNIEDTHVVSYALKKLQSHGLVTTGRRGKEKTVMITAPGQDACGRYRAVREKLLASGLKAFNVDRSAMRDASALLQVLSGQYDQAARSAASL